MLKSLNRTSALAIAAFAVVVGLGNAANAQGANPARDVELGSIVDRVSGMPTSGNSAAYSQDADPVRDIELGRHASSEAAQPSIGRSSQPSFVALAPGYQIEQGPRSGVQDFIDRLSNRSAL